MVGGEYRRLTESLVGPLALDAISRYNVRLAFVGTDGLSVERGMTTHLAEGAEIVKAMVGRAEISVLLADSSKYGRSGFVSVLPLSSVDTVITDDGLQPVAADELRAAAIDLRLV
jgi:DeoR family galactitol utilization operon repressor